eukprot:1161375-Pelagomonas_calceolata.AAC.2
MMHGGTRISIRENDSMGCVTGCPCWHEAPPLWLAAACVTMEVYPPFFSTMTSAKYHLHLNIVRTHY